MNFYPGTNVAMPGSRYILPSFEERTPYGYKRQDPYNKLFEDRIVFLGVQVDDVLAQAGKEQVGSVVQVMHSWVVQ